MQKQLETILQEAKDQLNKPLTVAETEEIRIRFLGKKGKLTEILRSMGSLSHEERKALGKEANNVRSQIEELLEERFAKAKEIQKAQTFMKEKIDVTEPGIRVELGVKHPITITINEISRIFMNMGFSIAEGPEG